MPVPPKNSSIAAKKRKIEGNAQTRIYTLFMNNKKTGKKAEMKCFLLVHPLRHLTI